MIRPTRLLLIGVVLAIGASRAVASPDAHGVISRYWKNPVTQLETSLWLTVNSESPAVASGAEAVTSIRIRTHLTLQGQPVLRPGEDEHYSLVAEYMQVPNGQANVRVRLTTSQASWVYRDDTGPVQFERTIPVYASGAYDVYFELRPVTRRRIVPPNTVAEVMVRKPGAEETVKFAWTDPGNVARAKTDYTFEVWEVRPLWWDKLICRTEVPESEPGMAILDISRNSSLISPGTFFRDKKDYQVLIRMKRTSPEYQSVWSEPAKIRFRYQGGDGGFREKFRTPFGNDFIPPEGSALDRIEKFDELHALPAGRF